MDTVAPNEPERLSAVRRYEILDTPPDGFFDRITAIAARRFGVPIAIISIVDHDRIWFKSHHGLPVTQIDREPGLCASAIMSGGSYVLEDASIDPRSLSNPLVAGEFGLRFYVGVPLRSSDGYGLGTLCVIDKAPRPVDQGQLDDLVDLASVVMDQMELRLAARRSLAHAALMAREIDHRVMNSLQFVSSLLTMQSRQPNLSNASTHLQAAASRVNAVAQVHRHFYVDNAENASSIGFLRRLCTELAAILAREVLVEGDEGNVPTTHIQPLGLIVNELVTNAAKHGAGRIAVNYRIHGNAHELCVSDEGAGFPEGFDPSKRSGLGMKVLASLVAQLRGSVIAQNDAQSGGACYTVCFPA